MNMHFRPVVWGLAVGIVLSWAGAVQAELQSVSVSGELRIRGSYWRNAYNPRISPTVVGPEVRIPSSFVIGRPIGDAIGGQNVTSHWKWDSSGQDYQLTEQRTLLGITAEFTDAVSAYIELEHFQAWGTDFRSNVISGIDRAAGAPSGVSLYQAYIETEETWGMPLRLRIGRQELVLGSGWLVGNNQHHPEFVGLSFDGVRATWATDVWSVDAFFSKLAERSFIEKDGDINFSGVYASYKGLENIELDAYWLWVRDARNIEDVRGLWFNEWLEDLRGLDDYGASNLHTVGVRAAGFVGNFDFNVEAAYQFGPAYHVGALFKPFLYGDDSARYDSFALDAEAGYTFDTTWQPRVYLGGAYFEGEDNRSLSFWQWINPLRKPTASVSFSRLFSDRVYSPIIDEMSQLSNAWTAFAGVDLAPSDRLHVNLNVAYFQALETFDLPPRYRLGPIMVPIAGPYTFWTWNNSDELGWEASLKASYRYSDDLEFEAGWHHFFTKDGLTTGNYTDYHGLLFSGGTDDKDADYFYVQTKISF